jgi:hypothetical protein
MRDHIGLMLHKLGAQEIVVVARLGALDVPNRANKRI